MSSYVPAFIGCGGEYETASVVLFGAPFDSTTSFRPGTRFASRTMRAESDGLEIYSPYQDAELNGANVFDGGDLELPFGNASRAVDEIERYCTQIANDRKIPAMIGGEHLVTLGAVRALAKKHPDLTIVHFDAHTDLRDVYMDEKLSHATVMRRVWDLTGDSRIFQFGIRSGENEEFLWAKDHVVMQKFCFDGLENALKTIKDRPVYLSVDLDVLDPSVLPGTGTPEAGGVCFDALRNACMAVLQKNVVGFDMVELCPVYDRSGASTAAACKLLREMLIAVSMS